VDFKKTTELCDDEQERMSDGSEFQTVGAGTLKPLAQISPERRSRSRGYWAPRASPYFKHW